MDRRWIAILPHVPLDENLAYIFTKSIPKSRLNHSCTRDFDTVKSSIKIGVQLPKNNFRNWQLLSSQSFKIQKYSMTIFASFCHTLSRGQSPF